MNFFFNFTAHVERFDEKVRWETKPQIRNFPVRPTFNSYFIFPEIARWSKITEAQLGAKLLER